mmetsp:Transcript_15696/g.19140  ORF Transcript_15696/g.19140 Transcript_15696/m.19140 type:complete len:266 (-) Transcript_15696:102-899(-)
MAETHKLRTSDILAKTENFKRLNKKAEELAASCFSAPVPSLDHLRMADYDVVYEPSDDTYLMLDALAYDFDIGEDKEHNESSTIRTVLEIGAGTGVNSIYLGNVLKRRQEKHPVKQYVTDINEDAIRITLQSAVENGLESDRIEAHICDLATPLLETLNQQVDVIIFNPPYVPTDDDEVGSNGIEASWAGGTDGRVVLDRALPQIAILLSRPNGVAYVITVDDNKPEEIAMLMMRKYGILVEPLVRRRARNEFLTVLKMSISRES